MDPTDDASRSPEQPIKRAPVVYGKRSNHISLPSTLDSAGGQQHDSFKHDHTSTPPSKRHQSSASPSVHASDTERSRSPDPTNPFQFGFRHRLKELDEEFDGRDAQSSRLGPSPSGETSRAGPSRVKDLQSVSMGTAALSSEARLSFGDLSPASFPQSPVAFHATSSQDHPPQSSPVRRRARRLPNLATSDSEAGAQSNSSSVSPVRHAITTPHSRSSPTPPTSGEILMTNREGKGKAPARDVLPLVFDVEQSFAAEFPIKSKKGRRSEPSVHPKTKAPTKKEQREAAFESSRIAANRPVEVIRTQEQKHSLSAFFAGLRRDNIATPTSGAELPSDPIEKFSSPTDNSKLVPPVNSVFGAPTGLLRTSTHIGTSNRPSSSERTKVLPPAAGDSDDEMPSVASIIQASGKRQNLQAIKQVALKHADANKTPDSSDDDDLLVIKDDMHSVAREEAAQRKLDKVHGSPVKDMTMLRIINHPSVRPAVVSPHKLSTRELQEFARPSFAPRGKSFKVQLTKKQLDELMLTQHNEEQLKSIKRHEEEWIKGGGRLSRDTGANGLETSLSQKLGAYAELGLKTVETDRRVEDKASADESDEDYNPELRGSASPEITDAEEDDGEPGDNMEISQVPRPEVDEEKEEEADEVVAPLRRNKSGQRRPRAVVGSDDEGEQSVHCSWPSVQRDTASSMESQTEDENDKENCAKLMYDRSEDKENKAVVRHELSSSDVAFGSRPGSLHGVEGGVPRILSPASVKGSNSTASSPKESVRSPLKDISKDEDDLFLSSPLANSSFTEGLLRSTAVSPPHPSASTLSLGSPPVLRSERIVRINRFSFDSENDENDPSGLKSMQPSFLEKLRSQVSSEPLLACIKPLPNGGFSQLFSAEDQSSTKRVNAEEKDGLSLTLDVELKPALEVSSTLRQKAETIFEKEQGYVVAAAVQNDRPKEVLYVNDHGFLTQTRPEGSSPQVYRMTPSQASKFIETQVHPILTQPLSARPPLRTLSFVSQEPSPVLQPLRRLRRRSPSPLEQKILGQNSNLAGKSNAFGLLGKTPSKAQKEKLGKSEFVVVEAEESDEDDMFGFGGPKKDDEGEEDDNDQDKVAEGLVDDTAMDAETEAAHLVLEKHREHEEEDDQRLQKLHQDAIEGKFRIKRRDRGVGLEDNSDESDDDDARRIRQRIRKKRKIEGDSLDALGQNEETRAFYNTYHQDLIDEDDEFRHLRGDATMSVDDDNAQPAEPEEQEMVSVDEIRQRVREMAQSKLEVEVMDPEDTSWIDQSMVNEADDAVCVKVVEYRRSKPAARYPNAGQMDFEVERPKRHEENEQERNQLASWARNYSHRYQGTGRSGNSAAVTGHTKIKTGGGSLRSTQSSNAVALSESRKPSKPKKTSSLLSAVSRSGKFA